MSDRYLPSCRGFLRSAVAYGYLHLKHGSNSSLPDLIEGILASADVKPHVRVLGADGKRLPGTEVVRFSNGNCEQAGIFRNAQLDNSGWATYPKLLAEDSSAPVLDPALIEDINNSLLEKEEEATTPREIGK